jgi:parvulin-like peptidyl-prolyl isomerase
MVREEDILSELSRRGVQNIQVFENTVHHIFFNPRHNPNQSANPTADALRRAQAALARLRRGESFTALADQVSEDPNHNPGGFLGIFKTGELSGDLDTTVNRLKVNEFSNIVRSKQGFHILMVVNRRASVNPALKRQMNEVREQLIEKSFQKVFADWIDQKKNEVFFRVFET